MKNVLVLIHDDAGQEARLQAALDLTRSLDGHLTCLDAVRMPEFMDDYVSAAGAMCMETDERERTSYNRSRLEKRLEHEGIGWEWALETGDMANILARRVDLSDIIVLNTDLQGHMTHHDMRAVTSRVAIKSRKPILAVPQQVAGFKADGCAVIFWDGSAPNVAALQAAAPILSLASEVIIVEISFRKSDKQVSANDAVAYLLRHGIKATIQHRRTMGVIPIVDLLLKAAHEHEADYAVMGAYGHLRLVEAVFGGVTREMLTRSMMPLILAH